MNKKENFSLLFQAKLKKALITLLMLLTLSFGSYAKHPGYGPMKNIPKTEIGVSNVGEATYYGNNYKGRRHTANGDVFNMHAMTCASNTHRFGTWLLVENLANGKSVIVKVTDRGGFKRGNVDLTYGAFGKIASYRSGRIKVKITVVPHP